MTTPVRDPAVDVDELHRNAARYGPRRREMPEPTEGTEPAPWWLWVLIVVSLFVGGFYLGRHGGLFSSDTHTGFLPPPTGAPTRPELAQPATGVDLYQSRCASCHQPDGRGLAGSYPPLVGSEYVVGPPEITIRIVLLGLTGTLTVAGQEYRGTMPSWRAQLTDDQIAKIISYLREQSGAPAIEAALVASVRQETASAASPMQAAELSSIETRRGDRPGAAGAR